MIFFELTSERGIKKRKSRAKTQDSDYLRPIIRKKCKLIIDSATLGAMPNN